MKIIKTKNKRQNLILIENKIELECQLTLFFLTLTIKLPLGWTLMGWEQQGLLTLFFFHSDFLCLEGDGVEHPPPLNVYFQSHPK